MVTAIELNSPEQMNALQPDKSMILIILEHLRDYNLVRKLSNANIPIGKTMPALLAGREEDDYSFIVKGRSIIDILHLDTGYHRIKTTVPNGDYQFEHGALRVRPVSVNFDEGLSLISAGMFVITDRQREFSRKFEGADI